MHPNKGLRLGYLMIKYPKIPLCPSLKLEAQLAVLQEQTYMKKRDLSKNKENPNVFLKLAEYALNVIISDAKSCS
jgi:hypothetical protein